MTITIHQPEYFPYLGFFDRLLASDTLVLLDNVQFQKGYINRNRIRTPQGWHWLTVPVDESDRRKPIEVVKIKAGASWQEQHCKALEFNYGRAPYFQDFFPVIKKIIMQNWQKISGLDAALIQELCNIFGLAIRIQKSSLLGVSGKATELLVNICKILNADVYLSGSGGKNYMDMDLFAAAQVAVQFQDFSHPIYKQQFVGEFQPNMSCLDYLFNCGSTLNLRKECV